MFGQQPGSTTSGLFGTKPTGSLFGTAPQQNTSPFGQQQQQSTAGGFLKGFGQQASSLSSMSTGGGIFGAPKPAFGSTAADGTSSFAFGNNTTGQTGLGGQSGSTLFGTGNTSQSLVPFVPSGTTVKFDPFKSTDTMMKNGTTQTINTKHVCITAMKTYENKSIEELRVDDYLAGRRWASAQTAPAATGPFGQQQTQQPTSIFAISSPFTSPTTNNPFAVAASQASSGLFGQQNVGGLFQNTNTTAFPNSSMGPTPAFGVGAQAKPAAAGIFGGSTASNIFAPQQSNQSSFPIGQTQQSAFTFPAPAQPQQPSNIFGNTAQQQKSSLFPGVTPAVSSAFPSQQQLGSSIFNQQQPSSTTGGIFGGLSSQQKPFGQPANNSFASSFLQPQQQQQQSLGAGSIFPSTGNALGSTQKSIFNPQPAGASLFNNAFNPGNAQQSFVSQQPSGGLFMPSSGSTVGGISTTIAGGGAAPILIGSNIDISDMQRAIIDAQLSTLPYGDSPLLKSAPLSPPGDRVKSPPGGIDGAAQRKLRYLASKGIVPNVYIGAPDPPKAALMPPIVTPPDKGSTPETATPSAVVSALMPPLFTPPNASGSTTTTTTVEKHQYQQPNQQHSLDQITINYRPLVLLPSVGFGASLGLDSTDRSNHYGPSSHSNRRTFLSSSGGESALQQHLMSSIGLGTRSKGHIKTLDMNVVDGSEKVGTTRPNTAMSEDHLPRHLYPIEIFGRHDDMQHTSGGGSLLYNTSSGGSQRDANSSSSAYAEEQRVSQKQQEKQIPFEEIARSKNDSQQSSRQASSCGSIVAANESPQRDQQKATLEKKEIKLTRPEYYCEPPVEVLNTELTQNGVCRIQAGLTVGRLGYGSVFWRGPFDLPADTDLDELVHFRNKEVVVYPDEEKKPVVGQGLNRRAEVSLDRVWPLDRHREAIKDVEELHKMNFRDKLERLSARMSATFQDYKPSTGTWQFIVDHFSKYGFIDESDDVEIVPPDPTMLHLQQPESSNFSPDHDVQYDIARKDARIQALVQRENVPLREVQHQIMTSGDGKRMPTESSEAQLMCYGSTNGGPSIFPPTFSSDDEYFISNDFKRSRVDLDDTLFKSSTLLNRMLKQEVLTMETVDQQIEPAIKPKPEIVLREPVNKFVGITREMIQTLGSRSTIEIRKRLWPRQIPFQPFKARSSCRVSFCEDLRFSMLPSNSYMVCVELHQLHNLVPTVKSLFTEWLRASEQPVDALDSLLAESSLLRFHPIPSTMVRLFDAFVLQTYKKADQQQATSFVDQTPIKTLCGVLLMSVKNAEESRDQRIQMGCWLATQLQSNNDWAAELHEHKLLIQNQQSSNDSQGGAHRFTASVFQAIFISLINGDIDHAVWMAQKARMYSMAMFLSAWQSDCEPARMLRICAAKQLQCSVNASDGMYAAGRGFLSLTAAGFQQDGQSKIYALLSTLWACESANQEEVRFRTIAIEAMRSENSLNWLQLLGMIIWYWAERETTLSDCVDLMEKCGIVALP